jgi:hypothetical protein
MPLISFVLRAYSFLVAKIFSISIASAFPSIVSVLIHEIVYRNKYRGILSETIENVSISGCKKLRSPDRVVSRNLWVVIHEDGL